MTTVSTRVLKRLEDLVKQANQQDEQAYLKPIACPHCGHVGIYHEMSEDETYGWCTCDYCFATGPRVPLIGDFARTEVLLWNMRAGGQI